MAVTDDTKALRKKATQVDKALAKADPDAGCALHFMDPLQRLVSTILSAQTTDKSVNECTPALFAAFPDVAALAAATPEAVEPYIRRLGLYRAKAKNVVLTAQKLRDDFSGVVPDTIDELVTLPGVGRKTANCVVLNAYGKPDIMCDTHFCRITRRLGFHESDDPVKIEFIMAELLPPEKWGDFSHRVIIHGREICHARKPECGRCPLAKYCDFLLEGGGAS
ncbi:MAG: endonuclease III [Planctomycetaceae bacterium]|nr:endonuclease III [Planctomycetaceae bacterium]